LAAGSLIGTAGGVIYSSIKALFNFCKTPKTPPQKKTQRPIKIPVILLESSCTTPESPTQGSRSRIYQGLSISPSAITSSPNENNHGKSDDEREIIGNDQSDQSASITYHENGRDPENVSDFIDDYTKDHEAGLEILP
ncbi:MAG TPA: hypothetical protein VHM20_03220, partial [Gammaproteobacteria bacterium]|nr:hypothetical protein [Gammaproteobacteria bacterium]